MSTSPTSRADRAEPRIDPDFDLETDAILPPGDRSDSVRTTASREGPILWLVLLMAFAASADVVYLWGPNASQQPPAPAPTQPAVAAVAEPASRQPIGDWHGAESNPLPAPM